MLPDVIDSACEQEQMTTAVLVALQRSKLKYEQARDKHGNWPITECVDCGDDIPEGRLEMGKIRCVHCQEAKEKREARGLA